MSNYRKDSRTQCLVYSLGIAGASILAVLLFPALASAIDTTCASFGVTASQIMPPFVILAIGGIWCGFMRGSDAAPPPRESPEDLISVVCDPAVFLDNTRCIISINPAWTQRFGFTIESVLNKPITDFLTDDCRDAATKGIRDAVLKGKWNGNLEIQCANKRTAVSNVTIHQSIKLTTGFVATFQPPSGEPLSQALSPLPVAVLGVDADGIITRSNDEARRLFPNLKNGELAATAVPESLLVAVSSDSQSKSFSLPLSTGPHIRGWILKDAHTTARLIIAEDISDDLAIRGEAVFLNRCCDSINTACNQLSQCTPETIPVAMCAILEQIAMQLNLKAIGLAAEHPDSHLLQYVVTDKGPCPSIALAARGDASEAYESLAAGTAVDIKDPAALLPLGTNRARCIPIRAGGELVGTIALGYDAGLPPSPQSCSIATIIGTILAGKNARATAKLAISDLQGQLRQSQRLETVGILAGGIAHDFSNILTPISGFLQFAMQEVEPDSQAYADLEHVKEGTERARNLIRQILSSSRAAEMGRTNVDPADVLMRTAKLIRGPLPTTIILETDLAPGIVVHADPEQLHQVVLNICTNAYQAMRASGGKLSVSLGETELTREHPDLEVGMTPGRYALITISDDGPGMPKEVADHIFEPFFTTKADNEGTGLGLVVVSGIVAAHGGGIALTTAPGEGTTFRIYLPAATDSQSTKEENTLLPASERRAHTGRILFCDDEEGITSLATRRLRSCGFQVSGFLHAQEALDAYTATPDDFDVLVTDQTMPEMTGTELIEAIHKVTPNFPAILASGYSPSFATLDMEDLSVCAQFGASQFLRKPYMMDDLAQAITELLEKD